MTNVYATPEKVSMKTLLFRMAVQALENSGYKVERVPGSGKSSVRRITKGKESKVISIRTSQDTWIAFPRMENDKSWRTLDEVDAVVPVSVDDKHDPKIARVHLVPGDEMRDRFNRAYKARKDAGHSIPVGRGIWISLYNKEANDPVSHVGAGAGLKYPPIAEVPIEFGVAIADDVDDEAPAVKDQAPPMTIAEAKRLLSISLGVDPANIKIIVEG
jgi:hypothetical protein